MNYSILKKILIIKSLYYSLYFKGRLLVGRGKIYHDKTASIVWKTKFSSLLLGVHINVDTSSILSMFKDAKLIIGQGVSINRGTKVVIHEGGVLEIGSGTYINENSRIHCKKHIVIGDRCAIAWNVSIMDTDIHEIIKDREQVNNDADIHIGNNVWIGANSIILKGTIIEDNCIIGANSVIRGHLKSNRIYGGNPIKELGTFDSWKV